MAAARLGCIDRRRLIAVGAAAALAAPGLAAEGPQSHRLKLGRIDVVVASDGGFTLPLAFVLPKTPRAEADALLGADTTATFTPEINVVVLKTARRTVLVDAGGGTNFLAGMGHLPASLAAAGIAPAEITDVIFTHAHPDHLWGVWDEFENASRFPKARHVVSAMEWDHWTHPDTVRRSPEAMQGMAAGIARILKALEPALVRAKPGDAVAPGLTLVDTAGHTPGHVSVMAESEGRQLLIGGDALGHPRVSFERPDWVWGPDHDPDKAVATRRRLLDRLAADRIPLLGYHLPWPGLGFVEADGAAFRYVES